jgi:hypothetical protein
MEGSLRWERENFHQSKNELKLENDKKIRDKVNER